MGFVPKNLGSAERHRGLKAVMALVAVLGLTLTGCSSSNGEGGGNAKKGRESSEYFGYMVNTRLATTNSGTSFGNATGSAQLSSRLYPAVYVPGPSGQMIPNSDLVQTEELPADGANPGKRVVFTLSEKANFSDGTPVTCDDFLLAYTAGVMVSTFGSHMPLVTEIADFECQPHAKEFTVTFNEGEGDRWRYLFGPGTVMPAHALAKKAGMTLEDLDAALFNQDEDALQPVAQEWRYGFATTKDDFDPELQVSYGPFVIDHVGDSGEVVLKANEHYYGDQPALKNLTVWPSTADAKALAASGSLRVVDAESDKPDWLDINAEDNPYEVASTVGSLTDTLTLSHSGIFEDEAARQAFAACIDHATVAKVSSEKSGIEVPPVYIRTLRHDDPVATQLGSIKDAHKAVDMTRAASLSGTTIKIGYLGPDERYAAMVQSIKSMCAPAGITVEDRSAEYMSQHYLEMDPATWLPTIDAFLGPIDPMSEYTTPDSRLSQLAAIRKAEENLWTSVPSIPLAAQPRAFIIDRDVKGVVPYTGLAGIGWNMDRWSEAEEN